MRGHAGLPVPPKRVVATSGARRIVKSGYSQDHEHAWHLLSVSVSWPVRPR
jgi:hypothetical protein